MHHVFMLSAELEHAARAGRYHGLRLLVLIRQALEQIERHFPVGKAQAEAAAAGFPGFDYLIANASQAD